MFRFVCILLLFCSSSVFAIKSADGENDYPRFVVKTLTNAGMTNDQITWLSYLLGGELVYRGSDLESVLTSFGLSEHTSSSDLVPLAMAMRLTGTLVEPLRFLFLGGMDTAPMDVLLNKVSDKYKKNIQLYMAFSPIPLKSLYAHVKTFRHTGRNQPLMIETDVPDFQCLSAPSVCAHLLSVLVDRRLDDRPESQALMDALQALHPRDTGVSQKTVPEAQAGSNQNRASDERLQRCKAYEGSEQNILFHSDGSVKNVKLLSVISFGATGCVYKASIQDGSGENVAVKVTWKSEIVDLNSGLRMEAIDERAARVTLKTLDVDTRNMVMPIADALSKDGEQVWLVYELYEEGSLLSWLKRQPVVWVGDFVDILGKAIAPLNSLHTNPAALSHGDVSVNNWLVRKNGADVHLADFAYLRKQSDVEKWVKANHYPSMYHQPRHGIHGDIYKVGDSILYLLGQLQGKLKSHNLASLPKLWMWSLKWLHYPRDYKIAGIQKALEEIQALEVLAREKIKQHTPEEQEKYQLLSLENGSEVLVELAPGASDSHACSICKMGYFEAYQCEEGLRYCQYCQQTLTDDGGQLFWTRPVPHGVSDQYRVTVDGENWATDFRSDTGARMRFYGLSKGKCLYCDDKSNSLKDVAKHVRSSHSDKDTSRRSTRSQPISSSLSSASAKEQASTPPPSFSLQFPVVQITGEQMLWGPWAKEPAQTFQQLIHTHFSKIFPGNIVFGRKQTSGLVIHAGQFVNSLFVQLHSNKDEAQSFVQNYQFLHSRLGNPEWLLRPVATVHMRDRTDRYSTAYSGYDTRLVDFVRNLARMSDRKRVLVALEKSNALLDIIHKVHEQKLALGGINGTGIRFMEDGKVALHLRKWVNYQDEITVAQTAASEVYLPLVFLFISLTTGENGTPVSEDEYHTIVGMLEDADSDHWQDTLKQCQGELSCMTLKWVRNTLHGYKKRRVQLNEGLVQHILLLLKQIVELDVNTIDLHSDEISGSHAFAKVTTGFMDHAYTVQTGANEVWACDHEGCRSAYNRNNQKRVGANAHDSLRMCRDCFLGDKGLDFCEDCFSRLLKERDQYHKRNNQPSADTRILDARFQNVSLSSSHPNTKVSYGDRPQPSTGMVINHNMYSGKRNDGNWEWTRREREAHHSLKSQHGLPPQHRQHDQGYSSHTHLYPPSNRVTALSGAKRLPDEREITGFHSKSIYRMSGIQLSAKISFSEALRGAVSHSCAGCGNSVLPYRHLNTLNIHHCLDCGQWVCHGCYSNWTQGYGAHIGFFNGCPGAYK